MSPSSSSVNTDEAEDGELIVEGQQARVGFLDGLRGIMCVVVVVFHSLSHVDFPKSTLGHYAVNGGRPVQVFWAVSGYALALVDTRERAAQAAAARLPRLMLPVLFLGLVTSCQAFFMTFDPLEFWKTERNIVDVFLLNSAGGYNFEHIWTMSVELYGSLALFLFHELFKNAEHPGRAVFVLAALAEYISPSYNYFLIGYVLRHRASWFRPYYDSAGGALISAAAAVLYFVTLAAEPRDGAPRAGHGWQMVRYIGVSCAFVCVLSTRYAVSLFDNVVTRFLGRYSFEMYVSHYPIVKKLQNVASLNGQDRAPLLVFVALLCTFAWTLLVQRHVNSASLKLAKKMASCVQGT